ncbi:MAG: 50S ribosomal protein L7/L12 [Candidatus Sumerlaeaceae bacterium]|nr:50S ribosomal protein L7/L12 [Candidatus Sumerlaeaceae bacterium]
MSEITIDQIVERLDSMTLLEINELVKKIEEKYGVSAAPVAVAAGPAVAGAGAAAAPVEEKTEFTVILKEVPADKKINIIKEVRAVTSLGLKEAKDLVEGAPKEVVKDVSKEEAEKVKKQLEAAGAVVEIK